MKDSEMTAKQVLTPVLEYDPNKPIFILNTEAHKAISIAVDMILKKYGNEGITIYNILIGNNILVKDELMAQLVGVLNDHMTPLSDGKSQ